MTEKFRTPRKIARRLTYSALAMKKIHNWPAFMFNYALGLKAKSRYRFRNDACLAISRGIDHASIVEIFLNEEYGRVNDGAVIIDVGANIGVFTVFAMTTARDVRVFAYEPSAEFYPTLLQNLRLNAGCGRAHSFNLAVAADDRGRDLYLDSDAFFFPTLVRARDSRSQESERVNSLTLAQIMESNKLDEVDLLKMDCEGSEYEILYSSPGSHLRRIKEIRMEYHNIDSGERQLEGLTQFFDRNGLAVTQVRRTSKTNGTLWARRRDIGRHN
jgi:FkbM family methyltransferase